MARAITTQQDFLEHVAGRRLILEDSWVIITPQGGVEGVGPDRKAITGTWYWSDTYFCRSIFFGVKDLP
ncbi:MAG: dihydrodipicolinate reductase, partial [Pseudomonadota bacterium]